jgi:hypothetical protein
MPHHACKPFPQRRWVCMRHVTVCDQCDMSRSQLNIVTSQRACENTLKTLRHTQSHKEVDYSTPILAWHPSNYITQWQFGLWPVKKHWMGSKNINNPIWVLTAFHLSPSQTGSLFTTHTAVHCTFIATVRPGLLFSVSFFPQIDHTSLNHKYYWSHMLYSAGRCGYWFH